MLVHQSRLHAWPRSTSDDPYFGPYKIRSVDGLCMEQRLELLAVGDKHIDAQLFGRLFRMVARVVKGQ